MDKILFEKDAEWDEEEEIKDEEAADANAAKMENWCQANPATRSGRIIQLVQMLFLPSLPIAALIIQDCIQMARVVNLKQDMNNSMTQVKIRYYVGAVQLTLEILTRQFYP